jgi:soluble lytic murein transglycosylase-like protein
MERIGNNGPSLRQEERMGFGNVIAIAALCLGAAAPAWGDVLEIGPNGEAVMISGPAPAPAASGAPSARHATRLAALRPHLSEAGAQAALSPQLLEAVAWTESRFNPAARSRVGAIGAMQLMPATAAQLGVDPTKTSDNVRGGARYLRLMLEEFDGDLELALAAYNAGPEAVRRHGGVPPYRETRAFIASVLGYMASSAAPEQNP